jgi:hypothetical protein
MPMPNLAMLSAQRWGALRGDPAESVTQTSTRQAEGVTQEGSSTGRWLSRSKGVGRHIGKSVCHKPET